jgi:hypothetical protein
MAVGTTFDFKLTRNDIIEAAYKKIGVLAEGEVLSGELTTDAVRALNMLVREFDVAGKWLWTIPAAPSTVTLVANTWVYTSSNGLPTNILRLEKATYRDATADDQELEMWTMEQYESKSNKLEIGAPAAVYLTSHITIGSQTLFVWPTLSSVNTQSEVTGTDALNYRCIRNHTADSTNRPITGANYLQFWEQGGSSGSAWATSTSYTAPQHLRLWFRRPLWDFDGATDNPDFPQSWFRILVYNLAYDLSFDHGIPREQRIDLKQTAKGAFEDIFRQVQPVATDVHHKTEYY